MPRGRRRFSSLDFIPTAVGSLANGTARPEDFRMASRRTMSRLFYFTIEDEGMLAEAFSNLDSSTFAITYKVVQTEDVFVCTSETKDALDRSDVPYNLLAHEDASRIAVFHSPLSREELADFEDPIRALALAYQAVAMACVGTNGESDLGFDLSDGTTKYNLLHRAGRTHVHLPALHRAGRSAQLPRQVDHRRSRSDGVGGVDSASVQRRARFVPLSLSPALG